MRSMGHPDYVYTPRPASVRDRMSQAHRKRLGIPPGHRRVYGTHVPDQFAARLRDYAVRISYLIGRDKAENFVRSAEADNWEPSMPPLFAADYRDWALMIELLSENMTREEVAQYVGVTEWYMNRELSRRRKEGKL